MDKGEQKPPLFLLQALSGRKKERLNCDPSLSKITEIKYPSKIRKVVCNYQQFESGFCFKISYVSIQSLTKYS